MAIGPETKEEFATALRKHKLDNPLDEEAGEILKDHSPEAIKTAYAMLSIAQEFEENEFRKNLQEKILKEENIESIEFEVESILREKGYTWRHDAEFLDKAQPTYDRL